MSEERKNCFVESFEALCDKGDFVLANKVKMYIDWPQEKNISVEALEGYLNWLDYYPPDERAIKDKIAGIKERLAERKDAPTLGQSMDLDVCLNSITDVREKLIKINFKRKSLRHKFINLCDNLGTAYHKIKYFNEDIKEMVKINLTKKAEKDVD